MRWTRTLAGAILLAGCRSRGATTPAAPIIVTLDGPATVQGVDTTVEGQVIHACLYSLTVIVSGGETDAVVSWGAGRYSVTGQDGSMHSHQYAGGAAVLFAGNDAVENGTWPEGDSYTEPFHFSETLYYSAPTVATDSVTYSFSCR